MAGLVAVEMPNDWKSKECKIPHTVQYLVADELVFEAKSFFVQYTHLVQNDGILKRTPSSETSGFQALIFIQETVGAGRADLAFEIG